MRDDISPHLASNENAGWNFAGWRVSDIAGLAVLSVGGLVSLFLFGWFLCHGQGACDSFWLVVGIWMLAGLLLAAARLYFLPTIIANRRRHPDAKAIAVVNVLFGFTLLGWGLSLAWAMIGLPQR